MKSNWYSTLSSEEAELLGLAVTEFIEQDVGECSDDAGEHTAQWSESPAAKLSPSTLARSSRSGATESQMQDLIAYAKARNPAVGTHRYVSDSHGLALVCHTQGDAKLFDYPVPSQHFVTLRFFKAEFAKGESAVGDIEPLDGENLLEVALSPDQYVRALRSEEALVPCTIQRSFGRLNDNPPSAQDSSESDLHNAESTLTSQWALVNDAIEELNEFLVSVPLTSKKRRQEVADSIDSIAQLVAECESTMTDTKVTAVQNLVARHKRNLSDHVKREATRLGPQQSALLLERIDGVVGVERHD